MLEVKGVKDVDIEKLLATLASDYGTAGLPARSVSRLLTVTV